MTKPRQPAATSIAETREFAARAAERAQAIKRHRVNQPLQLTIPPDELQMWRDQLAAPCHPALRAASLSAMIRYCVNSTIARLASEEGS
jgi:hypothetical protein